jgi:hypothetical protein|nr:MAG TPA: hypothetical protein [Caudoviricetes sp.]
MVNMVTVNDERCVVGATIPSWWYATSITCDGIHATCTTNNKTKTNPEHKAAACYVRARRAARALHATAIPKQKKRKEKERREKKKRSRE